MTWNRYEPGHSYSVNISRKDIDSEGYGNLRGGGRRAGVEQYRN